MKHQNDDSAQPPERAHSPLPPTLQDRDQSLIPSALVASIAANQLAVIELVGIQVLHANNCIRELEGRERKN